MEPTGGSIPSFGQVGKSPATAASIRQGGNCEETGRPDGVDRLDPRRGIYADFLARAIDVVEWHDGAGIWWLLHVSLSQMGLSRHPRTTLPTRSIFPGSRTTCRTRPPPPLPPSAREYTPAQSADRHRPEAHWLNPSILSPVVTATSPTFCAAGTGGTPKSYARLQQSGFDDEFVSSRGDERPHLAWVEREHRSHRRGTCRGPPSADSFNRDSPRHSNPIPTQAEHAALAGLLRWVIAQQASTCRLRTFRWSGYPVARNGVVDSGRRVAPQIRAWCPRQLAGRGRSRFSYR